MPGLAARKLPKEPLDEKARRYTSSWLYSLLFKYIAYPVNKFVSGSTLPPFLRSATQILSTLHMNSQYRYTFRDPEGSFIVSSAS